MKKLTPLAILAALALAACNNSSPDTTDAATDSNTEIENGNAGSGSGHDSGDMAVETGDSNGASDDEFVAACLSASNQTESMCTCLSEKAEADLTETSREFLIATLNEQSDEVTELRSRMSMEEMSTAGMFLVTASTQCAREGRQ
jgi:hypothetical protein